MANHTIYVSKKGLAVWNKCVDMAKWEGISMSALVERELKKWVLAEESRRAKLSERYEQTRIGDYQKVK